MNNRKKVKTLHAEDQVKKLGLRIRQLRKVAGYTSAETFANEKGFPRALYGKYENGKNIEFLTLIKLVNSFGISLKEFFDEGFDS